MTRQDAYKAGLSTPNALPSIAYYWCKSLDSLQTSHVTAAFIDMSKAFDRLDLDILLSKLITPDTHPVLVNLINSTKWKAVQCEAERAITLLRNIYWHTGNLARTLAMACLHWRPHRPIQLWDCQVCRWPRIVHLISEVKSVSGNATPNRIRSGDWRGRPEQHDSQRLNDTATHLMLLEPKYEPILHMNGFSLDTCTESVCSKLGSRLHTMRELRLNASRLLLYYTTNIILPHCITYIYAW